MSLIPFDSASPVARMRQSRALARAERDINAYELEVIKIREYELLKLAAAGDVAEYGLWRELSLYNQGMRAAAGSPATEYLVAKKAAAFAEANNERLNELFGGHR